MTKKYEIILRYIKDLSVEIPNVESFLLSREYITKYSLGLNITTNPIKNEMLDNIEGGYTIHYPSKKQMSIYDASIKYNKSKTPLVVIAGKDYGMGSSRDWAAKGTNLLGVKAVIAESYERIHRSNLIGMGVLPFVFKDGENRKSLKLEGPEKITISGIKDNLKPQSFYNAMIVYKNGKNITTEIKLLVNTSTEVEYLNSGGILQYVLKELVNS